MTLQDGRFIPQTKAEILDDLLVVAEEAWGREFSADEEATLVHFYDPIAQYQSEQQQALREVLDAAQLEHATGQALDYLAELIGVPRREAAAAETRITFSSDDPVTQDYTIPEGTRIQTDSADPVSFRTDSVTALEYIDGFESGNIYDYSGDTGSFQAQGTTTSVGSNALEATASGEIANLEFDIEIGATYHYQQNLSADAKAGFIFAAFDLDNYYDITINETDGTIEIGLVEGGTRSVLDSTTADITADEWHDITLSWEHGGTFIVTVADSSGTVGSIEHNEAVPTFESGGIGFTSSTANSAFFDEVTTSAVSVSATATSVGEETNVAPEALEILSTSINGVDSATNNIAATEGRDEEADDEYRIRAQNELSQGTRATLPAVINALDQLEPTKTVTVIDNDSQTDDVDGRPGHSFEAVVDAPEESYTEIAETIVDVKAVGDTSVGGFSGTEVTRTVELSNGQTKDVAFSVPDAIMIYVDMEIDIDPNTYPGEDDVRTSIVQYIGGVLASGDNSDGDLGVGDDVVYNQIIEAIMDVRGVHDITSLDIDTSDPPAGQSNLTIEDFENATADGTDNSIAITTSEI